MIDDCKLYTEKSIIDEVTLITKKYINNPRVFVHTRELGRNSLTRTVRIVIVSSINNENLVNDLIKASLGKDWDFIGSETNLQGDNLEVDYLFVDAKIYTSIEE